MSKKSPETDVHIGIITVRDAAYHPNRRLLEASGQAGCEAVLIHPYRMWPTTTDRCLGFLGEHAGRPITVVLPRQGAEITDSSLALIHHFQRMGMCLINDHSAVSITRNKFLTQQVLTSAGLACPATAFINDGSGLAQAVAWLGGYPVVVKPVNARQGEGVILINNADDAGRRLLAGLDRKHGLLVQRYIAPDQRLDIRVLVIGGKAICAASLTPQKGEFRANFHLGGEIRPFDLADDLAETAVAAAKAVGCDVAGVDMMVMKKGHRPLILEVNYSPGFRGMEAASGMDIASRIIRLAIDRFQETSG